MSEPINFTVPLPEAGPGAFLTFDFADVVRLQEHFGPGYAAAVAKSLDANAPEDIKACMVIATKGGDPDAALRALPMAEVAGRIMNALSLRLYGKPFAE